MSYEIKTNDYVKPTEIRKEVVQRLLDYYVSSLDTCWNEFVPNNCWRRTYGLHKKLTCSGAWEDCLWANGHHSVGVMYADEVFVRTCEMKEFFKVWLGAGYYISKGYYSVRNQTAIIYKFQRTPYVRDGYKLVTEFTEDIDG
jgi:hypothetical protein